MALIEYLIVGGGGGGGGNYDISGAGGGGGGQVITGSANLAGSYAVTVGAGGIEGQGANQIAPPQGGCGNDGGASSFNGQTAVGGGGGGGNNPIADTRAGRNGGCSGGGASGTNVPPGTPSAGYSGGYGSSSAGAGGGGAGGAGIGGGANGGQGGAGVANSISGVSKYYAGGGGGGNNDPEVNNNANGGSGIGGEGGWKSGYNYALQHGMDATGSGGGGAGTGIPSNRGGVGGSGVVVMRYAGGQICTGGTVTSAGGYTIHTFTASGTFVVPVSAPTITLVDNTTTGEAYDATFIRGTTAYTHIWGTDLTNTTYGDVSPSTGVTAPLAAFGSDALIALNITVAADAALGARSLRVIANGYGSNWWTINIVPPAPTLTSIQNYGGAAGAGFLNTKVRVGLYGTNFSGSTVTINATNITVSNVSVASDTQITADFIGTANGNQSVSVTTAGGTTAVVNFPIYDAIPNPSINPGLIVNQITAPGRQVHPGTLGMAFTPVRDGLVTALGRWKFPTNTGMHTIILRDTADWLEVARATVNLNIGDGVTQWVYSTLTTPVLVKAGHLYVIVDSSIVYNGSDLWADVTHVLTDGNATVNGVMVEVSSMYGFTQGAARTDGYAVGYKFTATGAYNVMMLGRWKMPQNSLPHTVYLKDASGTVLRSAVIDCGAPWAVTNKFNYVPVSPYALTTGAVYYVETVEGNGDEWPNYQPNGINPWGGLTITDSCYEFLPVTNGVVPTPAGTGANSMHGAPDVMCWVAGWAGYSEAYVTTNLQWVPARQPMAMII